MSTLIPGTILAAQISPGNTSTTFPTHEDSYGRGGLMSFTNLLTTTTNSLPDRLPLDRQKTGMMLYDSNTTSYYALTSLSINTNLQRTRNPLFTVLTDRNALRLYNTEINGSLVTSGSVTLTGGNSESVILNVVNGRISLGYSAPLYGPNNDGAEIYMDFSEGDDQGQLYITTRDNGDEPIIFRQRQDSTAPEAFFEPVVIGRNHNVGINVPSFQRTFSKELTVFGDISASGDLYSSHLTVSEDISAGAVITDTIEVPVKINNISQTYTFTNNDTSKVFHFDTTTQPLCAIFPESLANGFNIAVMNTGTNNLRLSAVQLNSVGVVIGVQYGGAFIYKDNSQLFAVGRL